MKPGLLCTCAGALIGLAAPASAQYTMDTAPALEPGMIRYFGSAKDERGRLMGDVTFALRAGRINFIYVTDKDGRFRAALPKEMPAAKTEAKCMKAGYAVTELVKRPGPASGKPVVQVDCRLRRIAR